MRLTRRIDKLNQGRISGLHHTIDQQRIELRDLRRENRRLRERVAELEAMEDRVVADLQQREGLGRYLSRSA